MNRRQRERWLLRCERLAALPALCGVAILAWYVAQADPIGGPYGPLPFVVGFVLLIPLMYFYNER